MLTSGMTTLAEIEAAADSLSSVEQAELLAHLSARLQAGRVTSMRQRVKLPLIQCGPPGTLSINEELIAKIEAEQDADHHAASL